MGYANKGDVRCILIRMMILSIRSCPNERRFYGPGLTASSDFVELFYAPARVSFDGVQLLCSWIAWFSFTANAPQYNYFLRWIAPHEHGQIKWDAISWFLPPSDMSGVMHSDACLLVTFAVQAIRRTLLQHPSSNESDCLDFLLSQPGVATGLIRKAAANSWHPQCPEPVSWCTGFSLMYGQQCEFSLPISVYKSYEFGWIIVTETGAFIQLPKGQMALKGEVQTQWTGVLNSFPATWHGSLIITHPGTSILLRAACTFILRAQIELKINIWLMLKGAPGCAEQEVFLKDWAFQGQLTDRSFIHSFYLLNL